MKKVTILSFAVVTVAIAAIWGFNSCGKQDAGDPSKVENQSMSEQDLKINSLIKSFRAKMDYIRENPEYKSGEVMEVDSAIWYIDATLNYYYAKANHSYGVMHIDTIYLEMNVLDSYDAMYEEVFASYDASLYGLSEKYYAIEGENKQFIMAIVEDMGPLSNNRRDLRIVILTGTGSPTQSDDFGEDDAYYFNRDANTNCFGALSQSAPKIFEEMLNNYYNPEPGNNCRWYFFGASATLTFYYEDYQLNDPLTNYLDYKIFAASQSVEPITSETECLEWNQNNSGIHEMQFYYDNLIELIDEWLESGQNTNNLKFSPKSEIVSFDQTVYGCRLIKHIPTIVFRQRGIVLDVTELPPVY